MVLPSSMRLKGHKCFGHLHRQGLRFHSPSMLLRVVQAEPKLLNSRYKAIESRACRCAVAISTKVSKKAVIRNRLRRHLHDHLRLRLEHAPQNSHAWALLSLKSGCAAKQIDPILEECDRLLRDAGLFL